jgi:Reverse transcriptase (RNA-dependent DNA polymerase)
MCYSKKSIYSLVQAARAWWKQVTNSLQKIGFNKCPSDNCLMMRINNIGIMILCIYVDDVCVFGVQDVNLAIKQIESIYSIKRVGALKEFVGVNIEIKNNNLYLGQVDTVKRLECKFQNDVTKMKIYKTPAGANKTVKRPNKDDELLEKETQEKHQSGVGIIL